MSGIYIKDMSKPQNCHKCPFLYVTSVCDGSKECPLIPVPDHGDLIDRDALLDAWDEKHTIPSAAAKVMEKTVIPADNAGQRYRRR